MLKFDVPVVKKTFEHEQVVRLSSGVWGLVESLWGRDGAESGTAACPQSLPGGGLC